MIKFTLGALAGALGTLALITWSEPNVTERERIINEMLCRMCDVLENYV